MAWLHENPGWLLILDNVDDAHAAEAVERLLPQLGDGHVLITSRFGEWSGAVERLDLEILTPEASIEFLKERTQGRRRIEPDVEASVTALAKELDGLPLALEQAAAFIVAKGESFAGYLKRWKAREVKVRTWHDAVRMNYPHIVAVTWDTSFDQLHPASRGLLNMLSWYAPDPIPVAVWQTEAAETAIAKVALSLRDRSEQVEPAPTNQPDPTNITNPTSDLGEDPRSCRGATGLPFDAEEARAGLSRYGLINWTADRGAFGVHRLVQEVTRERLDEAEATASLQAGLDVLNAYLPEDPPPQDVRSWPIWNPVRVHAAALIEHADQHGLANRTTRLMNDLGLLLMTKGLWNEAERFYRRALAIEEGVGSLFRPTTLPVESGLTEKDSRPCDANPRVAIALNNLAQLLQATNCLAEAEPLMRRALAIFRASLGDEHPSTLSVAGNHDWLLAAMKPGDPK